MDHRARIIDRDDLRWWLEWKGGRDRDQYFLNIIPNENDLGHSFVFYLPPGSVHCGWMRKISHQWAEYHYYYYQWQRV